ncbi:MAG: calcium-binding protein, partial [Pseudomonadota bacterium]
MNAIPPGSTAPALGATAARTTLDVIADRTQRRRDLSTVGTPITAAFIGLLLAQRPAWAEQAAEATEGDGIEPIGSSEAAARTAAAGTVVGLAEGTDPMVRSASPSGSPVTTTSAPGDDSWIEIAVPIDGTISATSGLDISPPVPPGSGDLTFYMTAMENEFGDFFVDGQAELDIDYGDPLNPFGVYLSGSGLIIGTPYDDVLIGADTDDTIYGLAGDDFIDGRGGNDVVFAGSGNDQVFGGTGNDYLDLGSGNDRGFGQEGDDTIVVGTGNDTADGGSGDDVLVGGPANDLGVNNLYGGFGSDTYFVNAIGDIPDESFVIDDLASNSVVFGSEFDNLTGGRLPFFLSNDSFDLASGLSSSQYYFVNISSGIQNFAIGGEYGAVLYGSYDDNLLYGNAGNNTIFSVAGNNVIAGGGGSDYLYGGGGNDRYLLDVAGNGIDVIQDSGGRNSLVVDGVGMAALGFV